MQCEKCLWSFHCLGKLFYGAIHLPSPLESSIKYSAHKNTAFYLLRIYLRFVKLTLSCKGLKYFMITKYFKPKAQHCSKLVATLFSQYFQSMVLIIQFWKSCLPLTKNEGLDLVSVQLLELQIQASYLCMKPASSNVSLVTCYPVVYAWLALQRFCNLHSLCSKRLDFRD